MDIKIPSRTRDFNDSQGLVFNIHNAQLNGYYYYYYPLISLWGTQMNTTKDVGVSIQ